MIDTLPFNGVGVMALNTQHPMPTTNAAIALGITQGAIALSLKMIANLLQNLQNIVQIILARSHNLKSGKY